MSFFRQYIAPFLIILVFLFTLVAITYRSFLPPELAAPAPTFEMSINTDDSALF
jgi:hypothetical protein